MRLPDISPHFILVSGAAAALLMTLAGLHLGQRGTGHLEPLPQVALNSTPQSHASALPCKTEATQPTAAMPEARQEASAMTAAAAATAPAPAQQPVTGSIHEAAPVPKNRPVHPLSGTPQWPMVLKLADSASFPGQEALPPQIQAAVQKLQDQFVKEVGGTNQNPADPAYASRWLQASQRADDLLRAQIGWPAFNAYSLSLARAQATPQ